MRLQGLQLKPNVVQACQNCPNRLATCIGRQVHTANLQVPDGLQPSCPSAAAQPPRLTAVHKFVLLRNAHPFTPGHLRFRRWPCRGQLNPRRELVPQRGRCLRVTPPIVTDISAVGTTTRPGTEQRAVRRRIGQRRLNSILWNACLERSQQLDRKREPRPAHMHCAPSWQVQHTHTHTHMPKPKMKMIRPEP